MEEIHIDDDGNVNDNGDDDDDGEEDGDDDADPNIAQSLQFSEPSWNWKVKVKISSLAWPCCSVLQTAKLEWETLLCKRREKGKTEKSERSS